MALQLVDNNCARQFTIQILRAEYHDTVQTPRVSVIRIPDQPTFVKRSIVSPRGKYIESLQNLVYVTTVSTL